MPARPSGYSGTPLAKKLGLAESTHLLVRGAPEEYASWLAPLPEGVVFERRLSARTDVVHVFCERRADLGRQLARLRTSIRSDAAVWVSWPKQASKLPTDVSENTIRELALPLGFVDVKVCAVNETWSGLKLVVRKELR